MIIQDFMLPELAVGDWIYFKDMGAIQFVSDLRQVGDFLRILQFPALIKLTSTI
jgi:hypothetical protein